MRVTIRQKNLEVTPALREYIEKKIIAHIEKIVKGRTLSVLPILDLEVARTSRHHRKGVDVYSISATLTLNGKVLRAQAEAEDARSACDLLQGELEREVVKFRSRAQTLLKRGARKAKKDLNFDPAARLYRKGRIRNEGN